MECRKVGSTWQANWMFMSFQPTEREKQALQAKAYATATAVTASGTATAVTAAQAACATAVARGGGATEAHVILDYPQ